VEKDVVCCTLEDQKRRVSKESLILGKNLFLNNLLRGKKTRKAGTELVITICKS